MYLVEDVDALPVGDPLQVFVSAMCLYAASLLNGLRRGPHRDCDARAFARELLIPRELRERPPPDPALAAAALGVPETELRGAVDRTLSYWRRIMNGSLQPTLEVVVTLAGVLRLSSQDICR